MYREREEQRRSPFGPILRPDAALVGRDDFAADRQPKPMAPRPRLGPARLHKLIKDRLQFRLWNAHTVITDTHYHGLRLTLEAKFDAPTVRRELHCIAQEVPEHLHDLGRIEEEVTRHVRRVEVDREVLFGSQGAELIYHCGEQRAEIDTAELAGHSARFPFGEIQQVVE